MFFDDFFQSTATTKLAGLAEALREPIEQGMSIERWGDLPQWLTAFEQLPAVKPSHCQLRNSVEIGCSEDLSPEQAQKLEQQLRQLMPWRKGPFELFGIHIDTEWRSDWKWQRVLPHLRPLKDRTILDVGCGNGYHCLRMLGEGAKRVVGIDPSPRFVLQFYLLKHFLNRSFEQALPVDVLPVGIEHLPAELGLFDTTLSMGVFYHRRSPMDHLRELKDTLVPGGELVLETLVIDGGLGQVLVPEGRYAMMNNVWFLPSCPTLESWLAKCGFKNIRVCDVNTTSLEEQRKTSWMEYYSLEDFLDPQDPTKTVEGHPAPKRAVVIAQKPK